MHAIVKDNLAGIIDLCRKHRVAKLEIFGSAAGDNAFDSARSDLDFLVEFGPLEPEAHADAYFALLFALQELFGRGIDLVETPAIRNPYFLRAVNQSRQLVYAA
jgi:uncharacterized protein